MILDVATADLEAAETLLGAFHPTSWYFRQALAEARQAWDRLRAEVGSAMLRVALEQPPIAVLTLSAETHEGPHVQLVPISGQTYRAERVPGSDLAPIQWRLTRLSPPLADGPYYVCRLTDGSTQCDCADWTYQVAETGSRILCKHLEALDSLGWI
ncbi:MAG TPA: hypothetical protein VGZ22_26575 [Isosphaeraceae bacterium]|jgi:hypothetical protein|nr:hypothetical protein [Isosphaeraceae bacterium]